VFYFINIIVEYRKGVINMNSKECELSSIYKMKKSEDIPYNLPEGLSVYFYIEFYMQAMHILKDVDYERYNICKQKLQELTIIEEELNL
jgi:hypothetical protein